MAEQQHGGGLDRAIVINGGVRSDWLDLSTGINPTPYPVCDMPTDVWHRLPDESLLADCLAAARDYYQVPDEAYIVAAPGTQALIQMLPKIVSANAISIVSPTYNEHENCWRQSGAAVHPISSLDGAKGTVVVVNPNNPTGSRYELNELIDAARHINRTAGTLIVDEAFCDVTPELSVVSKLPHNTIVLKSFGKFFGLAGLRLGFAICSSDLAEKIEQQLGPWAVSGPALYLGAKAMRDLTWVAKTRAALNRKRDALEKLLVRFDFKIIGATDLFVTASHSDSERLVKLLAQNHILVRSFDYESSWIRFGLPAGDAEFQRLERALAHAKSHK